MLGDCGPIKRIDLIKTTNADTGAKLSRGFGFVTFALEADAAKAVNTVHGKRWVSRAAPEMDFARMGATAVVQIFVV